SALSIEFSAVAVLFSFKMIKNVCLVKGTITLPKTCRLPVKIVVTLQRSAWNFFPKNFMVAKIKPSDWSRCEDGSRVEGIFTGELNLDFLEREENDRLVKIKWSTKWTKLGKIKVCRDCFLHAVKKDGFIQLTIDDTEVRLVFEEVKLESTTPVSEEEAAMDCCPN
ncbi:hypothetical protein OTU49_012785, partial [Cherax quadricarinatus]